MALLFVGGEIMLFVVYTLARGTFYYWAKMKGAVAIVGSFWA